MPVKKSEKETLPLIAIMRGIRPEEVLEHAEVLYEEGFRYIEVPANSPQWHKSVTTLSDHFGKKAIIGAGTILTLEDYNLLRKTGARLMVSPNINEELIKKALSDKMEVCAGALTPTEIVRAIQLGVTMIKIFPAGNLGPSYCKSILSILPRHIKYFAVGGITPENVGEYLKAGCHGAGLGSDLYNAGQSSETTRRNAKRYSKLFSREKITYTNVNDK